MRRLLDWFGASFKILELAKVIEPGAEHSSTGFFIPISPSSPKTKKPGHFRNRVYHTNKVIKLHNLREVEIIPLRSLFSFLAIVLSKPPQYWFR